MHHFYGLSGRQMNFSIEFTCYPDDTVHLVKGYQAGGNPESDCAVFSPYLIDDTTFFMEGYFSHTYMSTGTE